MSKVSVIISVYNSAPYLEKCIDSILEQTFDDFELICVDDGSKDSSGKILDEYQQKDRRVVVIHRKECSGSAAVPRNTGLDIAKGEYVSILDSDDWFDSHMLEKFVNAAEKNDADLVMCDNYMVDGDMKYIQSEGELHHAFLPDKSVFNASDIPEIIFQISNATAWHKLIKRDLIEKNTLRFQEQTPILDDIYFVNMIDVLAKKITIVDEKLVYYRYERPDAQTVRINKNPDSIHKAFCALYDGLAKNNLYQKFSTSFRVWAINTYEWWLSSVTDYEAYCYLIGKYRSAWLSDLGLLTVDQSRLRSNLVTFLRMVVDCNFVKSRKEVVESLKHGSRIAIYGAGRFGQKAYSFLNSYGKHDIVAWCDRNAEIMERKDVCPISKLLTKDFDALIICIQDKTISGKVKEELIKLGIDKNKIYFFR